MTTIEERLNEIETERQEQFKVIRAAQSTITELNTVRQNIIMLREE